MSSLPAVPLSVSPGKEAVGGVPIDALQVAASPPMGAKLDCDVADREADATNMAPAIPGMWNVVVCVVVYLCLCNPYHRLFKESPRAILSVTSFAPSVLF